jgi:hypothetical protein
MTKLEKIIQLEAHISKLEEALKSVLPYAENEAAGLADVDEPEFADQAWDIIENAKRLLEK